MPVSITDSLSAAVPASPFAPRAESIGQSFVARHAGLQHIAVYLSTLDISAPGRLTLHLRDSALPGANDIRLGVATILPLGAPQWVSFDFPPLAESHNQSYYFFIQSDLLRNAQLSVEPLGSGAYRDGAMYLNDQAQDAQMPVQFGYAADLLALDLLAWLWRAVQASLVMLCVFMLPGLALQTLLLPLASWPQRIALAAGISLCLYPLIMLWALVAGVQLGALTVWLPVTLGIIFLAWCALRTARAGVWRARMPSRAWLASHLPELTWLALVALIVFVRLFVLRAVDEPMWGDSVQHAVISQLMLDHGGLFQSWQPYAPYSTLTVHYGFHAAVAAVAWFTGEPVLAAMLLTGQIINVLAIITPTLIASRLTSSRWAGVGVLLVAGLLSPLPMEYLNWGRYPQLAGQAIMPVAVWWLWQSFEHKQVRAIPQVAIGALLLAGTFLAYYRMPYYVAAFLLALGIIYGAMAIRALRVRWRSPILLWTVTGIVTAALLLPWLLRLFGSHLSGDVEAGVTLGSPIASVMNEYQIYFNLEPLLPQALIVASLMIAVWGLLRRHSALAVVALWTIAIVLLPASRLLRVPGAINLQGFAIVISLYIPLGLLSGYGVDAGLDWLSRQAESATRARRGMVVALVCLGILALLGARDRLGVVDQAYRILAPADVRAMQWINSHVPVDALFLVDGFLVYNGTSVVGSDGGWYLPLLTKRRNTMPPQYALVSERPADTTYNSLVVDLVTRLRKDGVTSAAGIELLCRSHITHVYVGEEQGGNGVPPPQPMLPIAALMQSPAFTTLYRQDKVGIFSLNEAACR